MSFNAKIYYFYSAGTVIQLKLQKLSKYLEPVWF